MGLGLKPLSPRFRKLVKVGIEVGVGVGLEVKGLGLGLGLGPTVPSVSVPVGVELLAVVSPRDGGAAERVHRLRLGFRRVGVGVGVEVEGLGLGLGLGPTVPSISIPSYLSA